MVKNYREVYAKAYAEFEILKKKYPDRVMTYVPDDPDALMDFAIKLMTYPSNWEGENKEKTYKLFMQIMERRDDLLGCL